MGMLDRNLFLHDFDATLARLVRRGVDPDLPNRLAEGLNSRRKTIQEVEELRANLNRRSVEIGDLIRTRETDKAEAAKAEVAALKGRLATLQECLKKYETEVEQLLLSIPNVPDDRVVDGAGEEDNVVLRVENYDAKQFEGKTWRPHWEVAENLGLYDPERASKLSGSMFALLRKDGARLLRALVNFGMDLHRDTYEEIVVPHFVTTETFTSTGHLPKFADDAYKIQDEELWVVPTGEVPLTALHRGEILDGGDLPKRYMTYTACFRREAGSAGKDTRGLQRLHEFHKVELVRLCDPKTADDEWEGLLADAEKTLQTLELPYRVLDLCAADLTFSSSRIFDLEVYSPGVDRWLEVSSVGLFTDYQTRRGNTRFRRQTKAKPEYPYALNGSGAATPRLWAAILEHGQQPDGSVRLPDALVPYMGGQEVISR